ncbi:MAG: hypothetical protein EBU07_19390, partial [Betaproteobacteria bacterium]|nr:hypothetical protein [Betaproteobacteria bacterium]
MGGWTRSLDAATLIDCHVHNHAARLHPPQQCAGHQLRRRSAGDEHRTDHEIRPRDILLKRVARGIDGVEATAELRSERAQTRQGLIKHGDPGFKPQRHPDCVASNHTAADVPQALGLMASGATAIAYETVTAADGSLPLLAPMSEVAGRLAVQAGARCLEKVMGGAGLLLGGVPGVAPAEVVVIGGGVVGSNAIRMALG